MTEGVREQQPHAQARTGQRALSMHEAACPFDSAERRSSVQTATPLCSLVCVLCSSLSSSAAASIHVCVLTSMVIR